ncbi:MAG: hypothetical protein JXB48_06385 [Candidatus Latescibacteria bacterium]|nr:hypothetical protein [Candidatus Latescibacterota bacterium]
MFEGIIGQEAAKKTIGSMITTDRIPHALLFAGPYGVGKGETALEIARKLLCVNGLKSDCTTCNSCKRAVKLEHPDLHILFPFRAQKSSESMSAWVDELQSSKKGIVSELYAPIVYEKSRQIVVDLVREVYERLLESSFEGGRKVCVIFNADRLNVHTANSLLKILEEPPSGVHFILTAEKLSYVLPTIVSRASVVRFRRLTEKEITAFLEKKHGLDHEKSVLYASLAEGSLKTAKAYAFESKSDIRIRSYDMYKDVALGDHDDAVSQAYSFSWSRDVAEAEELIEGFILCTGSVLKQKYGMDRYHNNDPENIVKLSRLTDIDSLYRLAVRLEEGLEMLGRNVNIPTVMTSIFYEINDTYRYKQHQRQ